MTTLRRVYWDLETEALPMAELEKVMPEFEAAGNIKDPIKIAASIAEKKVDWIDKAALKAITGKIVAFTSALFENEPEMVIGDEKTIIELAVDRLKECIALNTNAYAWNGSGFDLPFLCQRAAVYDIPAFHHLTTASRGKYYWNEYLVDPKLVWSNYSPDHTGSSLKTVAAALGVGIKIGNGKDFANLLKTNPEEAKSYALNDVNLLRAIIKRMGV